MQEEPLIPPVLLIMHFALIVILYAWNSAFFASVNSWWSKASKNKDGIINFTCHHQSNSNTKTPVNIIKVLLIHVVFYLLSLYPLQIYNYCFFLQFAKQLWQPHFFPLNFNFSFKKKLWHKTQPQLLIYVKIYPISINSTFSRKKSIR